MIAIVRVTALALFLLGLVLAMHTRGLREQVHVRGVEERKPRP